jgi:dolichol-phosphate mannosyltransferase
MATQRATAAGPVVASVIVPAYREGANVRPLVTQLFAALEAAKSPVVNKNNVEMIYVDDNSPDNTRAEVEDLSKSGYPVRVIVRTSERGLSSAVMRGFDEAKGSLMLCMDADLQHPADKVPELLEALNKTGVEFVIGTRYAKGVSIDKDWPLYRRVISSGARVLALGLSPLSDPMTGFFGIRKDVYLRGKAKVNNVGFKICLELFVKSAVQKSAEVPFSFGVRVAGESKLTGKVIVKYLEQLWQLYNYKYPGVFPVGLILLLLLGLYILYMVLGVVF